MEIRVDNDLGYDKKFFSSRGLVKAPRAQRRKPVVMAADLNAAVKKARQGHKGNAYQHTKTGSREDLDGVVARSAWEANTMRVLQLHRISFEFEPTTFYFPPDKNGRIHAYLPDIYLTDSDEYVEVKGYLDARGRNKLRKFKKNYPEEFAKLWVVISKSNKTNKFFFKKLGVKGIIYYEHLGSLYRNKIVNWEG